MAQLGSALDWGSSGRRFKSCQPDAGQGYFCTPDHPRKQAVYANQYANQPRKQISASSGLRDSAARRVHRRPHPRVTTRQTYRARPPEQLELVVEHLPPAVDVTSALVIRAGPAPDTAHLVWPVHVRPNWAPSTSTAPRAAVSLV